MTLHLSLSFYFKCKQLEMCDVVSVTKTKQKQRTRDQRKGYYFRKIGESIYVIFNFLLGKM